MYTVHHWFLQLCPGQTSHHKAVQKSMCNARPCGAWLSQTVKLTVNLRNPAVGPDQFQQNLKPTCLPVVSISLEVFLRIRATQMYIYLLTYLLT